MAFTLFNRPLYLASLLNLLLFLLFTLLATPSFSTNEDVFISYSLGGGFGTPPTELSHYNHLVHPLLGFIIKTLTHVTASINWYTWALLAAHYIACTAIAWHILLSSPKVVGLTAYLLLFVLFECPFLLSLSFTNACLLLSIAGLLFFRRYRCKRTPKALVAGIALLLLASLFRIHTIIPVAGIVLPFLFFPVSKKTATYIGGSLAFVLVAIIALNQLHVSWYTAKNTQWPQEESYRQHVYAFYNHHNLYTPQPGENWYTERHLISSGLTIDSSFLSTDKLDQMYLDLSTKKAPPANNDAGRMHWFLINNRLYFIAFLLCFVQAILCRKQWLLLAAATLFAIAGNYILAYYFKLSDYILTASLLTLGIFSFVLPQKETSLLPDTRRRWGFLIPALLLLLWAIIRFYKVNTKNILDNHEFVSAQSFMVTHPDQLFIVVGGQFPFQKCAAWNAPSKYLLSNFLNGEMLLQNMQLPVLKRFGSNSFPDIPSNDKIVFWGKRVAVLDDYFQQVGHKPVSIVPGNKSFPIEQVYRIIYP